MDDQEELDLRTASLQNAQAIFLARQRAERDLLTAKEALRKNEEQLRAITDATPALIAYLDTDCRYRFANLQHALWFGRPQEQLIGLHMREVLGDEAFARQQPHVERALSGEEVHFETEMPCRDAGVRFVKVAFHPDRSGDGAVHGIYVLVIDISDRKRVEDALRQTEGRLIMAMEAGQMGAWEWVVATGKVTWSPTLEAIHGLAPGTFGGTFEDFQRDMHPEDRTRVLATIQESVEKRAEYRLEYRIIRSGAVCWIEARGKLFVDDRGTPERMAGVCMDITERKKLEEVHARLAAVVEFSDDAIVSKSLDGIVATWNKGAERMFGYSAAEMIGKSITALIPPDYLSEEPRILDRVRRGEIVEPFESVRLRKDGTLIHVSLTVSPIKDQSGRIIGASKIARDITERRKSEQEREHLLASEQLARAKAEEAEYRARFLAEASASLTSTLDYETTLGNVSRAAVPGIADWCVVHLLQPDGAIRAVATAHFDPAKIAAAQQLQERYPEDPDSLFGVPAVLRSGKSLLYPEIPDDLLSSLARDDQHLAILRRLDFKSALIVPLIAGQRTLGAITLVAAESGRQFSEADLPFAEDLGARAAAAAENARLYHEIRLANAAKDHFIAVLSHELRTPLNPVLMTVTDLERDETVPANVREQMTIVRRNVELEARLIDDLLDSTRIANGKLQLQRTGVDARELLDRAVAIAEGDARAKDVSLEVTTCDTPCLVYGDPARVQQIFWNLVKNGVKFTAPGGWVRIRCEVVPGGMVRITVQDNGVGIAPEDLGRIFNAFDQGNTTGAHRFGGLGLGLAISKALAVMHEGTLTACSEGHGRGATFTVELPSAREAPAKPIVPLPPHRPRRALRLLVVEDHEATSSVMARLLSGRGYKVSVAGSLKEAIEILAGDEIDVLISDLGLPDGSGYELMKKVREERQLSGIALSGYGTPADVELSREAGFSAHLTKPIDIDKLDREIQALATGQKKV